MSLVKTSVRYNLPQRVTLYAYSVGQCVLYVFCFALALSLACIHRGENGTSSSSWKLPGRSPMLSFRAALFPDFSRELNTWSGALVLLQGLFHCQDGLGPGFGCDTSAAHKGLFLCLHLFSKFCHTFLV